MRKTLLFCVAMAIAFTPTLALADTTADAREAYRKGREAYKAGNYREALVYLQKAYKLKPLPALLRYTGETYYKMNKAREAIKYFRAYIKAAPMAVDRAKVEGKVRQLELIVGPGDDEEEEEMAPPPPPPPMPDEEEDDPAGTAAPPPPPPDPGTTEPDPATEPKAQPTKTQALGDDDENPLLAADRRRKAAARQHKRSGGGGRRGGKKSEGSSGLKIAGWTTVGLGAAGIIVGGIMAGLASGKASDLQDIVKAENPHMNNPKVSYSKAHHDMVVSYDQFNKGAIGGFVAGGVLLGTGVVLLLVDGMSGGKERADSGHKRVVVAPIIGEQLMGMTGQVSF